MVAKGIQAIRGMNDILPEKTALWRQVENSLIKTLTCYGYEEIRFPLLESTSLFKRTLGEVTDIVEKEMYSFDDLNGDSLSLRPEGTAPCVRACIEHGLLYNQQQKLWYLGPMFRHERPQKGRYRQFTQFAVEVFGIANPAIELELISMCYRLWETLGLSNSVQLQLNTLGELAERQKYKAELVSYFETHIHSLDEDSQKRLHKNPMRILDSKNPDMQALIANAPKLIDALGEESRAHFQAVCEGLDALNIPYTVNPVLVRGLDYYSHTVFEWVTDKLGSQATVCAGGRYDKLVEQLGGAPTSAIGFAMGLERLLLLMETLDVLKSQEPPFSIFIIAINQTAATQALILAQVIRKAYPKFIVEVNTAGGSFKSQFKKADKSKARFALILGEAEVQNQQVSIKDLRQETAQITIDQNKIREFLQDWQ